MDATKTLNPRWVELTRGVINACPYFDLQSMDLMDLGWGTAELAIELQKKHLQPFGIVHGGVLASIIDAACFWACYSQLPEEQGMTTAEIKLNYLAPVVSGKVTAKGKCIKLGKSLGLGEATVYDADGRMLAHGTSTVVVMPDMAIQAPEGTPPKFVE